ncbi:MAG: 2-oxoglutarate and iron-dependent oxygenase domain-containing protein [Pseudomonadota bacterium]|nr:2-oxoglutarate and iron-dependent oxygenase domain-containing protein [Pseudomonadota bacterium]MEC9458858.1 2-oxoglutarate and iron-dependent oxygenase domain-containing protein [Pseudomonadota bacterium]MEC9481217.1 2-oxoglutarate and iron-dependent oxygenase domain-containing protein [Pseudomonadota bacterium]
MESIPEISIKDFTKRKSSIAKEILQACEEVGFFFITDHDLNAELIRKALELSNMFFKLPNEVKLKYFIKEGAGQRGYTPYGIETAKDSVFPDQKEFWHHGRSHWDKKFDKVMPKNLLISEINEMNDSLNKLYSELEKLGQKILSAIAISLNLKNNWFDDKINNGNSILRLIHYPKLNKNDKGLRAEAHEDINLITLLLGTEQEGLEALNKNNEWIPVKVNSEKIVCNVGDMLERLTNDKLKSTTHRVNNPVKSKMNESRFSMPFFLHLNPDYLIETLSNCINDKTPNKYIEPITADDFLKIRLKEINLN